MITFISGGARSGKSTFAESYAQTLRQNSKYYYLATGLASDKEMQERIQRHKRSRAEIWHTVELRGNIAHWLENRKSTDIVLLDCLTTWLDYALFSEKCTLEELQDELLKWIDIANAKRLHLIIVSNDVNEGLPTNDRIVQCYTYVLEQLHHTLVSHSDVVVQIIAGVARYWKTSKRRRT